MKALILATMLAASTLVPLEAEKPSESEMEPLGTYEITAYAGGSLTATGTVPVPYKTVAVDPTIIPYGTQLYLEGVGIVTAEDCGGAIVGKRLDLYLPSEGECVQWGRQEREVWIVN